MAKQKISIKERLESARDLERQDNYAEALIRYRGIIRSDLLNTQAYNRMMIIYRRQKKYDAELKVIRQAIGAYEEAVASSQRAFGDRDNASAALSRKLAQSLGLLNDKGLPIYEEPHIVAWRKREGVTLKRLDAVERTRKK